MDRREARELLARMLHTSPEMFSARMTAALREAVHAMGGTGAPPGQPVRAGFVGAIELPTIFYPGRGNARGLLIPGPEDRVAAAWSRLQAFYGLLLEGSSGGSPLHNALRDILDGKWSVATPRGIGPMVLTSDHGDQLRIPHDPRLLAIEVDEASCRASWALAFGADETRLIDLLAAAAIPLDVAPQGTVAAIDPEGKPMSANLMRIDEYMLRPAQTITATDQLETWLREWSRRLYTALLAEHTPRWTPASNEIRWERLNGSAKNAWCAWVRQHTGMRRLELAVRGFFANGGSEATLAVTVSSSCNRRAFLEDSFDHSGVDRFCAPGLDFGWQQSIYEYAHNRDLIAITEAPRHLLTAPPRQCLLNSFRWQSCSSPYESPLLPTFSSPDPIELRQRHMLRVSGVLDRAIPGPLDRSIGICPWLVVDNPLSVSDADRYTLAPPSGHAAARYVRDVGITEPVSGARGPITRLTSEELELLSPYGYIFLATD